MQNPTEEKSKTLTVSLTPRSRKVIEAIRVDTGIPNTEAMSRILEWFAGLDRKLRTAVLVKDEEGKRELTRLAMLEMAGMDATDLPAAAEELDVEQAAKAAQALIQRLLTAYRIEVGHAKMEAKPKPKLKG